MAEDPKRELTPERTISKDDNDQEASSSPLKPPKRNITKKNCIKYCCGGISVFLLVLAIVIVTLAFTLFKVKEPEIRFNGITIDRSKLLSGTNLTLRADLSIKNPNYATLRYGNTTTTLFYRGTEVGKVRGPPGKSQARRTTRMNVSMDFDTRRLLQNPMMISSDVGSGLLPLTSFTMFGGKVKILKIIDRHVVTRMNCSITVNITTLVIQDQKCQQKVKVS